MKTDIHAAINIIESVTGFLDTSTAVGEAWETVTRFLDALPQPIPVSERLPAATDCDAGERCWQEEPGTATEPPAWNLVHRAQIIERAPNGRWLPADALPLPLPSGEVEG